MEKERPTGKWYRDQSVLPDNRFFTWIDDVQNAPDWAKYLGLVKPVMEPIYYEFDDQFGFKFTDLKMTLAAARATRSVRTQLEKELFDFERNRS